MILRGDQRAKQIIDRMVSDIEESLRNEDWEEDQYNREYGDEDDDGGNGLSDFFNSLGIDLPED